MVTSESDVCEVDTFLTLVTAAAVLPAKSDITVGSGNKGRLPQQYANVTANTSRLLKLHHTSEIK